MMTNNSKLLHFRQVMDEFAYDWDSDYHYIIHEFAPGEYNLNKTSIEIDDGQYFLSYKTSIYEISKESYESFKLFYDYIYMANGEIKKVMPLIADEIKKNNYLLEIGKTYLKLGNSYFYYRDGSYYMNMYNYNSNYSEDEQIEYKTYTLLKDLIELFQYSYEITKKL